MRRLVHLFKAAFRIFERARANLLSAAISFYAIFSLAPLAVMAVAVGGLVLEDETLRAQIEAYAADELGAEPARLIGQMMEQTANPGAGGLLASIISFLVLTYASTRLFVQLQRALNQIWDFTPAADGGLSKAVLRMAEKRLLSFGIVLLMGVLLIASVVASTVVTATGEELGRWISLPSWSTRAMELAGSGLILAGLFTLLFKVLPDARVPWRASLYGGLVAAVLFSIGRVALGVYFGRVAVESEYGAAGALVIVILWIYYSAQVLFLGAAFTRAAAEDDREVAVRTPWKFSLPPAWKASRGKNGAHGKKKEEAEERGSEKST